MLKITKGLKKKKKGKKSKHKDEELFDSAELEQYRREQQQKQEAGTAETSEAGSSEKGEEWEKFKALTSGVDDILKKTQGDLDRIKSTSYFQKKPTGSGSSTAAESGEVAKQAETKPSTKGKWVGFEESVNLEDKDEEDIQDNKVEETELSTAHQEEEIPEEAEEEESELEEEQDDIFDTSYVDVVASGEVKLAYVPDSPIKEEEGFDPFDTSIVDKVIKTDPKKRNLVSLGCAVEVLTGKLEKASGVPDSLKSPRRRPRTHDLLLDSFDEDEFPVNKVDTEVAVEAAPKSILDDDPFFAEKTSAVLEFPSVVSNPESKPISHTAEEEKSNSADLDIKNLVEEFIPCNLAEIPKDVQALEPDDDIDDEFAALAAESLAKKQTSVVTEKPPKPPRPELPKVVASTNLEGQIEAEEEEREVDEDFNEFDTGDDPFDTSFAAQVLPGKFELKLIEKEILTNDESELKSEFKLNSAVDILITNSANLSFKASELTEQEPLSLKHRDLLGGSTTDLSKIAPCPIVPKSVENQSNVLTNDDPFDTSIIDDLVAPGKTELKFLEKEFLTEEKKPSIEIEVDNDFNPRAEEKVNKPLTRPDNLSVSGNKRVSVPKIVAFDIKSPSNLPDLLTTGLEEVSKVNKPLTPYYPPGNVPLEKSDCNTTADPFDTSFVTNYPGKLELKLIEQELTSSELKRSLSDPDFDPRADTTEDQQIPVILKPIENTTPEQPDIISEEVKIEAKLHTPVTPRKITEVFEESEDFDPFDTSIANVLAPGKAEIKILETELIYAKENPPVNPINSIITETLTRKLTETKPVTDVLEQPAEDITVKPLTPVAASSIDQEDIDPFDTSIVGDILPGKTEIKLLESELLN